MFKTTTSSALLRFRQSSLMMAAKSTRQAQQQQQVSLASFSSSAAAASPSKETLFNELIDAANGIKDYNFKSYFVRRATEDKARMDSFSVEELSERVEQMHRIQTVQNLYTFQNQQSVMQKSKNVKQ